MIKSIFSAAAVMAWYSASLGGPSEADIQLAAESEKQCTATESVKATPHMIVEKVKEAVALIEKEGKKSFPKFKGAKSKFIFAGTYMWINNYDGLMLMHPTKPAMENQNLIGLKDSNGKRFFVDMITACKEKGEGWVDYMWPKPGEQTRSLKVGYVHKTTCDGVDIMVGCGVYDMTMEEVNAEMEKK
jgi:cytochrome c